MVRARGDEGTDQELRAAVTRVTQNIDDLIWVPRDPEWSLERGISHNCDVRLLLTENEWYFNVS
jgi:hypothetical protein